MFSSQKAIDPRTHKIMTRLTALKKAPRVSNIVFVRYKNVIVARSALLVKSVSVAYSIRKTIIKGGYTD